MVGQARETCPGALPIDRDFAEDFASLKRVKRARNYFAMGLFYGFLGSLCSVELTVGKGRLG